MLKVGLTGGIGSGKSTVCSLFSGLGVAVLDADQISRDLVTIGQPALALIEREFGPEVLTAEGQLNRPKLRDRIFSDPDAKKKLEALLHPLIYQALDSKLTQLDGRYAIVCVPLLIETGMRHWVDRVLVIDCPIEVQIERVLKRDRLPLAQTKAIIASQATRAARLSVADDLIDNANGPDTLAHQVKTLHNFYLSLTSSTQ